MTAIVQNSASSEVRRLTRELKLTKNEVAQIFVKPARFFATGFVYEDLEISDDKGYFAWNDPKGSCDLFFKYFNTGYDFNLYLIPHSAGVEIYDIEDWFKSRLIYNGLDQYVNFWEEEGDDKGSFVNYVIV